MKAFDLLSHAGRAKDILGVLAKHGFADFLTQLELPGGFLQKLLPHPKQDLTTEERIRLAAEELGPAFVKLGQFLSMRPDVLPQPLILELRKLQSSVNPLPFEVMKPVLVEALKGEPSAVFEDFDETPIAAASLAQVYFARLRVSHQPVAVKVQKPDIKKTMEIDLDLAHWLATQLHQRSENLKPYDLPSVVAEARKGMLAELDFRNEARNQQYFTLVNPHPEQVFAPAIYPAFCSEHVLTMDRIVGHNVAKTNVPLEIRKEIASRGAQSLVRQVLMDGFFHADPHAGNVLVTADNRLCFLDWGLVGHLTKRLRMALAEFWQAAVEQDAERIVQIAASLGKPDARLDLFAMEKEVTIALREELNFTLGRQELGRAMIKLLNIFGRHGISLSQDYTLMAKAVLSIEEIGHTLDPDFDLRQQTKPILRELYLDRAGPRALTRRVREMMRDALSGLRDLPSELHRLIRRLEHDDFTINFQHRGLEELDDALKTAANRIALGVIIGSLLIGSSLIVTTGIRPYLLGYPALGIIGYIISAVLALYVIWDIIRSRGHK